MILQLLLELQTRLRTGLAAGGMILLSDLRLLELQKKVGVLATKSPVFQRLPICFKVWRTIPSCLRTGCWKRCHCWKRC